MVYSLTKSNYLHGLQCHKRLWYENNHPVERKAESFNFNGKSLGAQRLATCNTIRTYAVEHSDACCSVIYRRKHPMKSIPPAFKDSNGLDKRGCT